MLSPLSSCLFTQNLPYLGFDMHSSIQTYFKIFLIHFLCINDNRGNNDDNTKTQSPTIKRIILFFR